MFSGNQTNINSTMHLAKQEKAFSKEKDCLKGYPKISTTHYKTDKTNPSNKKGFVRLDSLEDYEVIDFDMVNHKPNSKSQTDFSVHRNQEHTAQTNQFDSRHYHPAGHKPPPYSYSNCQTGMNSKLQQYQEHPISSIACEATKLANHFIPWQNSCQTSIGNYQNPFSSNVGPFSPERSRFGSFRSQAPFCDIREDIGHHVPFNLSTGQYEYWMSMPSTGGNLNRETMQAYCHNSLPNHRFPSRHFPAQISKSVSSWVGGLYNWVASSVDSALKPNTPNLSNIGSNKSEKESTLKPLNPNAKEFTPQIVLNPNAKEFLPSKMQLCPSSEASESIPVPSSMTIMTPTGENNIITITCPSDDGLDDQSCRIASEAKEIDVLNESDSDLSQLVIEQLIQETNKEKKMESLPSKELFQNENKCAGLSVPARKKEEQDQYQLKSVTTRKTTPWITLRKNLASITAQETPKTACHLPPEANNPVDDEELSDEAESDSDESDDEFLDEISPRVGFESMSRIRKNSSRKQSASSSCDDFDIEFNCSRMRSLSVCSDESNFIEFGTPPNSEQEPFSCDTSHLSNSPKGPKDPINMTPEKKVEKPKRCLLKTFVVHAKAYVQNLEQDTDINDSDKESDSDDDPDWDEVDGEEDMADDPLWQSFKARVFVCPMSTKEVPNDSNTDELKKENSPPAIGIISIDSIFLQNISDSKPAIESGMNPSKKTPKEIQDANEKWNSFYNDFDPTRNNSSPNMQSKCKRIRCLKNGVPQEKSISKGHVTIAPVGSFMVILENPEESDALRESRNGEYSCDNLARRKADKDRMEKLMAPVFNLEHRQKMWDNIQSGAYTNSENSNYAGDE